MISSAAEKRSPEWFPKSEPPEMDARSSIKLGVAAVSFTANLRILFF